MAFAARPFKGEEDVPAVVRLRREIAETMPASLTVSEAEIRNRYLKPCPGWKQEQTLWEEDGRLLGMLEAHTSELPESEPVVYLNARIHPSAQQSGLGEAVVVAGEEMARRWRGQTTEAEISTYRDATWAVELVERLGYRLARVFERMVIDAREPFRAEPVASGYGIRPLAGVDEVDRWIDLYNVAFRDHYDFHPISREQRLRDMNLASQEPDLDLVAVGPDGDLAGFCWIVRRDLDGGDVAWYMELVGTHPVCRRRGLAGALVSAGLERIRARGGRRVFLEVDSTSPTGANRLYERLGFHVETAFLDYRKRLG